MYPLSQNGPLFHWDHLRKELLKHYGTENVTLQNVDMTWIDQYVNQIIKNAVPNNMITIDDEEEAAPPMPSFNRGSNDITRPKQGKKIGQPEIFETHDQIIVLIKQIDETDLENYRLFLNGNTIVVRNIDSGSEYPIKLPSGISFSKAEAYYKNSRLEVRIHTVETQSMIPIPIERK